MRNTKPFLIVGLILVISAVLVLFLRPIPDKTTTSCVGFIVNFCYTTGAATFYGLDFDVAAAVALATLGVFALVYGAGR